MNTPSIYSPKQYLIAWSVHLFTAIGALLGIFTLYEVYHHAFIKAFWLMAATIIIDGLDGTLARRAHVKTILPGFDGALLDNIVDYLNYVVTPCFFFLVMPNLLPVAYAPWIIGLVSLTSAYQFCQSDAKTPDHFFKGFPCYWNIVLFYMVVFGTSDVINASLLIIFSILIFVPIKYVYPSRLDYLTDSKALKWVMHGLALMFAISTIMVLWQYPNFNPLWLNLSLFYIVIYGVASLYRTFRPLPL